MQRFIPFLASLALTGCGEEIPVDLGIDAEASFTHSGEQARSAGSADEVVAAYVQVETLRLRWQHEGHDADEHDADEHDADEHDADDEHDHWREIDVEGSEPIDLLHLSEGAPLDLGRVWLRRGEVTELRLVLDEDFDPYVELADGSQASLEAPSGTSSGLKAKGLVAVEGDPGPVLVARVTAESDLHETGEGKWILQPVLELVAIEVGPEHDSGGQAERGSEGPR